MTPCSLLASLQRFAVFSGLVIATAIPVLASGQNAGTYDLVICSRPCTESDTGVVRGKLVLFAAPFAADTLPENLRSTLTARYSRLLREGANACFTLVTGSRYIDGRQLYAGITRQSLARWEIKEGAVRVPLYRSPDAHFTLVGAFESGRYVGRGDQGICCGYPDPPATFFVATRVGEPDISACL